MATIQASAEMAAAPRASNNSHTGARSDCIPPPVCGSRATGDGVGTTAAAFALWTVNVTGVPSTSAGVIVSAVSAAAAAPVGRPASWSVTTMSLPNAGSGAGSPLQAAVRFQPAGRVKAAELFGMNSESLNVADPLTPESHTFLTPVGAAGRIEEP